MSLPRVTFLVDCPNWAFDFIARSISRRLKHRYVFDIKYACYDDMLDEKNIDLLYVFFWGEKSYKKYKIDKSKIIKEVASLRWKYDDKYGKLDVADFVAKYLDDCSCVTTPSVALYNLLQPYFVELFHCQDGVETDLFCVEKDRTLPERLRIGWVGNPYDASKGLLDILLPASAGYDFKYTSGRMSRSQLAKFYREIDVLAIASIAESQPLPLLESMSSGCFPVATNVGIVPEIIENGENGLVVERSVEAFRGAFEWCEENLLHIRGSGGSNRKLACSRSWNACVGRFAEIFDYVLANNRNCAKQKPVSVVKNVSDKKKSDNLNCYNNNECVDKKTSIMLTCSEIKTRFYYGDRYGGGLRSLFCKRIK